MWSRGARFPARSAIPVLWPRCTCTVPLAVLLRPVTGIDQVSPPLLVVGVPILPPVMAVPASEKSAATFVFTPVTASLNVARNVTLVRFVNWPAGDERLIDVSVGAVWSSV